MWNAIAILNIIVTFFFALQQEGFIWYCKDKVKFARIKILLLHTFCLNISFIKGTDPLKIDQIFHFLFFCEKYTPFHPLSFGMTTITVGQREVRLAGVQRLRALSERRLSFVLTGVSFILFYLFYIFFFHLLLLYNILYSQQ